MFQCLQIYSIFFSLLQGSKVISQEIDAAFPSTRSNFCSLHAQVENNELALREALRGINITAAITDNFRTTENSNPEVSMRILNEVARRAGFNVEYYVTERPRENETYTDLLLRTLSQYDIGCDWWEKRLERLDMGIVYPEPWYDASTILIIKKDSASNTSFNFWAFSMPFTPDLWILTLVVVILTGVVYFCLDYFKSKLIGEDMDTKFLESIFFSFHAFTGHCNYNAKSHSTKLLTVSMCFLYLILISAYTANLANFFILKRTPSQSINDVNDLVLNDLKLCAPRGYGSTEYIQNTFPELDVVLVEDTTGPEVEALTTLTEGGCDITMQSVEEWKTFRRDEFYNSECNMEWVGRRVENLYAGFALQDSRYLCSSLLDNVMNLHLMEMREAGRIDQIWEEFRESTTRSTCQHFNADDEENNSTVQLSVRNLGGAFIFHVILVIISILFAFYELYFQPNEVKTLIVDDLLTSLDDIVKVTKNPFDLGGTVDTQSDDQSSTEKKPTRETSIVQLNEICSNLNPEFLQSLILQNQLLCSQKLEFNSNIAQKNGSLFHRKFEDIVTKQQSELYELNEKLERIYELINQV